MQIIIIDIGVLFNIQILIKIENIYKNIKNMA